MNFLKKVQFWQKRKEKLNVRKMCSVQFCALVWFLLCKKFTTYCLKSVPTCSVIWRKRTDFPVLYRIIAYHYIITHICLQTALHLHKSISILKQDNNILICLWKTEVLNINLNLFRYYIIHTTTWVKNLRKMPRKLHVL